MTLFVPLHAFALAAPRPDPDVRTQRLVKRAGTVRRPAAAQVARWLTHPDGRVVAATLRRVTLRVDHDAVVQPVMPHLLVRARTEAAASGWVWSPLLDALADIAGWQEASVPVALRAGVVNALGGLADTEVHALARAYRSTALTHLLARHAPVVGPETVPVLLANDEDVAPLLAVRMPVGSPAALVLWQWILDAVSDFQAPLPRRGRQGVAEARHGSLVAAGYAAWQLLQSGHAMPSVLVERLVACCARRPAVAVPRLGTPPWVREEARVYSSVALHAVVPLTAEHLHAIARVVPVRDRAAIEALVRHPGFARTSRGTRLLVIRRLLRGPEPQTWARRLVRVDAMRAFPALRMQLACIGDVVVDGWLAMDGGPARFGRALAALERADPGEAVALVTAVPTDHLRALGPHRLVPYLASPVAAVRVAALAALAAPSWSPLAGASDRPMRRNRVQ
jgi:hypothetical protein